MTSVVRSWGDGASAPGLQDLLAHSFGLLVSALQRRLPLAQRLLGASGRDQQIPEMLTDRRIGTVERERGAQTLFGVGVERQAELGPPQTVEVGGVLRIERQGALHV